MTTVPSCPPPSLAQINTALSQRRLCLPRIGGRAQLVHILLEEVPPFAYIAVLTNGAFVPLSERQWNSLLVVLGLCPEPSLKRAETRRKP